MNHISFTVSNLENSVAFFKDMLGLELVNTCERDKEFSERVTGIKDAHLKIAYLKAANCSIELIEYLTPKGMKVDTSTCNVGSAHVCFNVDNFDQLTKDLRKNDIKFAGDVCVIPAGPNKGKMVLYFEDPDSNTIEIISDGFADDGHN